MEELVIRKAKETDLAKIQQLSNNLGASGRAFDPEVGIEWATSKEGEKYYKDRIAEVSGVCFVAEYNNHIIGFISGSFKEQNAWTIIKKTALDNIFVLGEFRNKNIGKKLINKFEAWTRASGAKRIAVNAFYENKNAIEFYKKDGFILYDITLEKIL